MQDAVSARKEAERKYFDPLIADSDERKKAKEKAKMLKTEPKKSENRSPIATARIAAGYTQAKLSEAIGCTQKDISRWERGVYMPRAETLSKIAQVLHCKIDDLIK